MEFFGSALVILLVGIGLGWASKLSKQTEPLLVEDGWHLLQYPSTYKTLLFVLTAVIILLFAALHIALHIYTGSFTGHDESLWPLYLMYAYFGLTLGYLFAENYSVRISVGPQGVRGTSIWRGYREYDWDEIAELSYNTSLMWLKLTAKDKPSLRVHAMIAGFDTLREHYKAHLPAQIWQAADEAYVRKPVSWQ